jgi:hypothetical protein
MKGLNITIIYIHNKDKHKSHDGTIGEHENTGFVTTSTTNPNVVLHIAFPVTPEISSYP